MADHEVVTVRMQPDFSVGYTALHPQAGDGPAEVDGISELTPYGMVLAGIGTCTGILLHSYAASRKFPLAEVLVTLRYARDARKDCADCPEIETGKDRIEITLDLAGDLSAEQRRRLAEIAYRCPVGRMVSEGTPIVITPASPDAPATGGTHAS